jgi:DNA-binding MarR family transcriptional regulator
MNTAYSVDDLLRQATQSALDGQANDDDIRVYTFEEMIAPQPPPEWVVEGLLLPASVAIFAGHPGSKKTWSLLHLACCVAAGVDWLGHKTKQVPVLIVDEESGKNRLFDRTGKIARGLGLGSPLPIYSTVMAGFDLRDDEYIKKLRRIITKNGIGLVIIDALADTAPGADENLVKDMMPFMRNLRQLAEELNITIVLIHHNTKGGGSAYRGSSAIAGGVALLVSVQSEEGESLVKFEIVKSWDVEPGKFYAEAKWDALDDSFELVATTQNVSAPLAKAELIVLAYIGDNGTATVSDIKANVTGCTPSTARHALYQLMATGLVEKKNMSVGGRSIHAAYGLSSKGQIVYGQIKNSNNSH